eukprot:gnl/TRDRNA2_/TRDRNA2_74991_c1_seq1.p2 gnl/TRDRNA2_/TRDRNA2_74991_c1~~gnl/TRDRNA2_/TRDRNA2_74991_c1_seq1.p2  ORF type:complete len:119 (+),score=11.15 gnl/TRDRNA2_/TRDRNA2_74991_c1_seq1:105-461(+)
MAFSNPQEATMHAGIVAGCLWRHSVRRPLAMLVFELVSDQILHVARRVEGAASCAGPGGSKACWRCGSFHGGQCFSQIKLVQSEELSQRGIFGQPFPTPRLISHQHSQEGAKPAIAYI